MTTEPAEAHSPVGNDSPGHYVDPVPQPDIMADGHGILFAPCKERRIILVGKPVLPAPVCAVALSHPMVGVVPRIDHTVGGNGGEFSDIAPDGPDIGGQIGIIPKGDFIAEASGLHFRVFSETGADHSGGFMDQRMGKQFFFHKLVVGGQPGDVAHGSGPFS